MSSKKVYSKIERIPKGKAKDKITEGCLVLEGGAFRGLFTQGVLDCFMRHDINFSCVIGVSAGALSGLNYASGQIGRSARLNLGYRHDPDYVGIKALVHSKSPIRLDFCFDDYGLIEPFDEERFFSRPVRYIAVATNCLTGKPVFFEKDNCKNIYDAAKASASMPFISPMVNVDGIPCLDGGCSCKIPYEKAMELGYDKIIVVRTRDKDYRKKVNENMLNIGPYRNYPMFFESLKNSNSDYNRQCDEISRLEEEGKLFVIQPEDPVTVKRIEGNMSKLGHLYWTGYKSALKKIRGLRAFINQ